MHRLIPLLFAMLATASFGQPNWESKLAEKLPLLGHRNWIVIADSAYPMQTAPGIETIDTGGDQLEILGKVMAMLARTRHIRPIAHLDAELDHVSEKSAPGIGDYRQELARALRGSEVKRVLHERNIADLDEAGRSFVIVLLKTRLTLPYTSVFLQLDCGYWDAAREQTLREAMASAAKR